MPRRPTATRRGHSARRAVQRVGRLLQLGLVVAPLLLDLGLRDHELLAQRLQARAEGRSGPAGRATGRGRARRRGGGRCGSAAGGAPAALHAGRPSCCSQPWRRRWPACASPSPRRAPPSSARTWWRSARTRRARWRSARRARAPARVSRRGAAAAPRRSAWRGLVRAVASAHVLLRLEELLHLHERRLAVGREDVPRRLRRHLGELELHALPRQLRAVRVVSHPPGCRWGIRIFGAAGGGLQGPRRASQAALAALGSQ